MSTFILSPFNLMTSFSRVMFNVCISKKNITFQKNIQNLNLFDSFKAKQIKSNYAKPRLD